MLKIEDLKARDQLLVCDKQLLEQRLMVDDNSDLLHRLNLMEVYFIESISDKGVFLDTDFLDKGWGNEAFIPKEYLGYFRKVVQFPEHVTNEQIYYKYFQRLKTRMDRVGVNYEDLMYDRRDANKYDLVVGKVVYSKHTNDPLIIEEIKVVIMPYSGRKAHKIIYAGEGFRYDIINDIEDDNSNWYSAYQVEDVE